MNVFFTDIVSNLKIPLYQSTDFARGIDPITFILEKCKNHSNIKEVKENCHKNHSFKFKTIKRDDFLKKKIKSLDISKISQNSNIATKLIKEYEEFFGDFIIEASGFTAKNTVVSPNFLVWKFCGKAQFPRSFGRIA